ncbi:MAG: hypothetical protein JJE09_03095 [Bacteroidia bacterium]|nr:hypothetical protein [Bacteroidia bacterium]
MLAEINFTSIFGRFHPALVHLPIGILLLAFLFELLSKTKRYKKLKAAVRPALFFGTLSAVLAAFSGYILSNEGAYDDELLSQHKWMGFATAGLAFLIFLFSSKSFALPKKDQRKAVLVLFFPLVILLMVTGHWGSSLTRGEDYLFDSGTDSLDAANTQKIATQRQPIENVSEAKVYDDIIQPLLKEKCYACHSSKKQKGQLRLDEIELIKKGGKHGEIFTAGEPKESEIIKRTSLSIEEKGHMPPRREAQLTSSDIELIKWWITEGASFEKKVKELSKREELTNYLESLSSTQTVNSWLPIEEVAVADGAAIEELRSLGVSIGSVGGKSNYLSISFAGKKEVEQRDLELLKILSPQVIELNLARTTVSDDDLILISELKELRRLHVEHTLITDSGISHLQGCNNLFYLNLVETNVSDEALKIVNNIRSLKELYLFNTKVTKDGLQKLNSQIKMDTGGYELPFLATDTLIFGRK